GEGNRTGLRSDGDGRPGDLAAAGQSGVRRLAAIGDRGDGGARGRGGGADGGRGRLDGRRGDVDDDRRRRGARPVRQGTSGVDADGEERGGADPGARQRRQPAGRRLGCGVRDHERGARLLRERRVDDGRRVHEGGGGQRGGR